VQDAAESVSSGDLDVVPAGRSPGGRRMLPVSSAPIPMPADIAAWTACTLVLWKAIRHCRPWRLIASRTG
jgi:hypothetical protein